MCNWICPNCKKSDHSGCDMGVSTLVYYPPRYVDGVNVNPDRNITTSQITCYGCKRVYNHKENGESSVDNFVRKLKKKYIHNMDGEKTKEFFWE